MCGLNWVFFWNFKKDFQKKKKMELFDNKIDLISIHSEKDRDENSESILLKDFCGKIFNYFLLITRIDQPQILSGSGCHHSSNCKENKKNHQKHYNRFWSRFVERNSIIKWMLIRRKIFVERFLEESKINEEKKKL